MSAIILAVLTFYTLATLAQQTPTVLCVPGQCLQGYSNTTIGAVLAAPSAATDIHLLPGQYASDTSPQFLHDLLTSSSSSLSLSPGFNASTLPLPLNLALQPGLAIYANTLYSGQSAFTSLPSKPITNSSVPITGKALALSSSVWIATNSGSPSKRVIIWDSVPDISQLPLGSAGSLSFVDIQSTACSPPCAGSGICSVSGTCQCAPGFTGSSCESCASGFFGPECKSCPSECTTCDEGITGTGRCLKPIVANAPSTCNCLNGVCGSNGQCACNAGFTKADNGTECAKCSSGFFSTSTGDCKVCQLGCSQCTDGTGVCITCKPGFTQDTNDRTKCIPPQSITTTGQICPDGSFSSGTSCSPCSSSCETCTGGTSNDCIVCGSGRYSINGACVAANSDGICDGSNFIADNNKKECDSCDAKCTSCKIPNFNGASTVNQAQCTGCLPGFVLSNGKCLESCPSGTFISPQDNLTCIPCDTACSTCAGTSTFCLTCPSNSLASNGKCVSTCPQSTFPSTSSSTCLTCHPDCGTCTGPSFAQCASCPSSRPVLLNGRCLPTCGKSQYFDSASSSCQTCDASCSSCSGSGPSNCLACASSSQVLRGGSCIAANCKQVSSVILGLGVCLSELVSVPEASGTNTPAPLPSITGITTPTTAGKRQPLEWWQILLMALGCAFIFLVILWLCRRRARKQRAKKTAVFAASPGYGHARQGNGWKWRLVRFGEKLFGHKRSRRAVPVVGIIRPHPQESESVKLGKLRAAEEARGFDGVVPRVNAHEEDMVKLIGEYRYPSRPTSPQYGPYHNHNHKDRLFVERPRSIGEASQLSAPSIYSQMTGVPRKAPEPRQPMRKKDLTSRFSGSTYSSDERFGSGTGTAMRGGVVKKNPFWI
ncbi:Proprotein convertase subtilisin/kexin type 5 [Hypsizygus marmoreus]|uniref:Proprotein convertase subtilisin/kexin type 5 n=1 Tax=Hypsizygus marmoreus TaxID=39966 RepID=A0A369K9N6_HYPMA|nr:Proprotein convertase subtilisin/kexin type 5 [Hypsizygus marmoreus]